MRWGSENNDVTLDCCFVGDDAETIAVASDLGDAGIGSDVSIT
jgi:hypothetical protein